MVIMMYKDGKIDWELMVKFIQTSARDDEPTAVELLKAVYNDGLNDAADLASKRSRTMKVKNPIHFEVDKRALEAACLSVWIKDLKQ